MPAPVRTTAGKSPQKRSVGSVERDPGAPYVARTYEGFTVKWGQ